MSNSLVRRFAPPLYLSLSCCSSQAELDVATSSYEWNRKLLVDELATVVSLEQRMGGLQVIGTNSSNLLTAAEGKGRS